MSVCTTDRILAAVCNELTDRQGQIDGDRGLRSVSVRIRLSPGGKVVDISYRAESRGRGGSTPEPQPA